MLGESKEPATFPCYGPAPKLLPASTFGLVAALREAFPFFSRQVAKPRGGYRKRYPHGKQTCSSATRGYLRQAGGRSR